MIGTGLSALKMAHQMEIERVKAGVVVVRKGAGLTQEEAQKLAGQQPETVTEVTTLP